MDEDGYGFNGESNICSDISFDDAVLSVYYWDYLQVGLCNRAQCCSAGMDWYWTKLRIYRVQTQSDGLAEVLDFYGEHLC